VFRSFQVLTALLIVAWCVFFLHRGFAGEHPHPAPAPLPFSCAQLNREYAPIDAGGQVAPLCGATPDTDVTTGDG
jgi:hypothetical protein